MSGWTSERLAELVRVARTHTLEAVAERLGLDPLQVQGKARRLGLQFGENLALIGEGPLAPATPIAAAAVAAPSCEPIDVGDPDEGWSDRRLHALRTLWEKGLSAAEIGDHLGVTRNAVIGRIGRLREAGQDVERRVGRPPIKFVRPAARAHAIEGGGSAPRPAPALRPKVEQKSLAPRATPAQAAAATDDYKRVIAEVEAAAAAQDFPHAVDLFGLKSSSCRYPLWRADAGPAEPHLYCGAPHQVGSPYCRGHATLCMPAPGQRRAS